MLVVTDNTCECISKSNYSAKICCSKIESGVSRKVLFILFCEKSLALLHEIEFDFELIDFGGLFFKTFSPF